MKAGTETGETKTSAKIDLGKRRGKVGGESTWVTSHTQGGER